MTKSINIKRVELKYLLNQNQVNDFYHKLYRTPFSFIDDFEDRKINSLYFDKHDLEQLTNSTSGSNRKEKFRYRYYGNCEERLYGQWEIKQKTGIVTEKKTFQEIVDFNQLTKHIKEHRFSKIQTINNFLLKYPRVVKLISYKRKYFISSIFGNQFRATLDYDITSSVIPKLRHQKRSVHSFLIIELKIHKELYDNLKIDNFLNLSRIGFSKYVEA